jgi:hypothetical protein
LVLLSCNKWNDHPFVQQYNETFFLSQWFIMLCRWLLFWEVYTGQIHVIIILLNKGTCTCIVFSCWGWWDLIESQGCCNVFGGTLRNLKGTVTILWLHI